MVAPHAGQLELAPPVNGGRCDLRFEACARSVFVEVTATSDPFPWLRRPSDRADFDEHVVRERSTIEREFDPTVRLSEADRWLVFAGEDLQMAALAMTQGILVRPASTLSRPPRRR
jgi:hypothetical protein